MPAIEKESSLKETLGVGDSNIILRICEGLSKLAEATKPIQDKIAGSPVVYRSVCEAIENLAKHIKNAIPKE